MATNAEGPSPRWEGDERGAGIGNGAAFAPDARALLDAMACTGWVAESPEDHLRPRLAEHASQAPWRLTGAELGDDGVYVVDLVWSGTGNIAALRADVFALIGRVAESSTHVRQVVAGSRIEYRVVTGMLDGDSPFAPHGHLLTLRIAGPRLAAIIAGMQLSVPPRPEQGEF